MFTTQGKETHSVPVFQFHIKAKDACDSLFKARLKASLCRRLPVSKKNNHYQLSLFSSGAVLQETLDNVKCYYKLTLESITNSSQNKIIFKTCKESQVQTTDQKTTKADWPGCQSECDLMGGQEDVRIGFYDDPCNIWQYGGVGCNLPILKQTFKVMFHLLISLILPTSG
jgi:hypothetical protein